MPVVRPWLSAVGFACLMMVPVDAVRAQSDDDGIFAAWDRRVEAVQASQPHFISPIFTGTGRLVQAFRTDFTWRAAPDGNEMQYGSGKGFDLVPFSPIQLTVGLPSYMAHHNTADPDGFADWTMLLKYRLASHDAEHGNDILSFFLGASVPTGGRANGSQHAVLTPQLAAGKGWGDFDVQGTAGVGLPLSDAGEIGHAVTFNIAPQYHVAHYFWPELELNGTTWRGGSHAGRTQMFVVPGVIIGRFPLAHRVGFNFGTGIQFAVTSYHQYDHAVVASFQFPF